MTCRLIGIVCLLLIVADHLAAQVAGGPGFDSTPVQIPTLSKGASRAPTSKDILTIRDPHGISISPDGKYVAFVVGEAILETNSYRSGLFIISPEQGSNPICLGTVGLPLWDAINQWVEEAPRWSPDSKYIFRKARMTNSDNLQVWRWSVSGGKPIAVTHAKSNIRDYEISIDGERLLFTAEQAPDLTQVRQLSQTGIIYDGSFPINRNRGVVDEAMSLRPLPTETWLVNLSSSIERKATDKEVSEFGQWQSDLDEKVLDKFSKSPNSLQGHHIIDAKVSPDRKLVAYRFLPSNPALSKTLYQLFIKPVRGGTPKDVQFPADGYFPAQYWWSPDSTKLHFINVKADGRPATVLSVSASGGASKIVAEGSSFTTQWAGDRQGKFLVCARQSATEPSVISVIDLTTGMPRDLVDLNPEFKNIQIGAPIRIEGVNKLGDAWYAHIVKPLDYQDGRRYPTIVTTYRSGDFFLRGASGDENPIYVYAAHGFAVISFDYGREYRRFRPGEFDGFLSAESSPVASIQMAIEKGVEMGLVDPARVGITGYSRGTEQAAYAITHTNLFRAASGVAGDTSPYFYYMAPNAVKRNFTNYGLGGWPEGEIKQRWKQLAPELNVDRIHVPILNNDPDSEVLADLALYTSLTEMKKPVELIIYPDELHHINQPRHRYQMYERNVDWFRFWLKDEEDPDPAKAEQYKRWRELRKLQEQDQKKATVTPK